MVHQTISTNITSAPSASSNNNPMKHFSRAARRFLAVAILGGLGACAVVAPPLPPPVPSGVAPAPPAMVDPAKARWVASDWAELPGWESDAVHELWPALLRSCANPPLEWARVCTDAQGDTPASADAARAWLRQRLKPWRIETPEGAVNGLVTGYFEPLIEASRVARGAFRVPLHAAPADLASRRPYWTRQQIDTLPAAQAALRGRVIAYVADPLDALILQIQGSGRLQLTEADGQRKLVRMAFAGHNDHPYGSVGRWLIDQGALRADQASWPGIKAWARANPRRLNEMLWSNPRYVFFREQPLPNPELGPNGAQGVPLTPERSIAVDSQSVPYGTAVWLDTTEPLSNTALQRVVMAQDTGSAIVGAVRADYFWGWGDVAEQQAGRMKQPLRMWALWPRK